MSSRKPRVGYFKEEEMDAHQVSSKVNLLAVICLLLSLILFPFVFGRILWDTSLFEDVITDEGARFVARGGFLVAQPLGWLNFLIGNKIISIQRKISYRIIGITGIIIGVLGILTGLIWSVILVFFSP